MNRNMFLEDLVALQKMPMMGHPPKTNWLLRLLLLLRQCRPGDEQLWLMICDDRLGSWLSMPHRLCRLPSSALCRFTDGGFLEPKGLCDSVVIVADLLGKDCLLDVDLTFWIALKT